MKDRGDPMLILEEKAWPQQFVIGNDETELELSVESTSFVNRHFSSTRCAKNFSSISFSTMATGIQNPKEEERVANIDHNSSNIIHSGAGAILYVFEDNEAVIKMIIKGRSPTIETCSRTYRVALDWLFDLTNLDPKTPNSLH